RRISPRCASAAGSSVRPASAWLSRASLSVWLPREPEQGLAPPPSEKHRAYAHQAPYVSQSHEYVVPPNRKSRRRFRRTLAATPGQQTPLAESSEIAAKTSIPKQSAAWFRR